MIARSLTILACALLAFVEAKDPGKFAYYYVIKL